MLTLKQKLQLFKLAKKPRRQIRLKLQLIGEQLNLPSVHIETTEQSSPATSTKQQRVNEKINNFRKVDNIKRYASSMSGSIVIPREEALESKWVNGNGNSKQSIYQKEYSSGNVKKLYHANSRTEELLRSFDFNLKKKEGKGQKIKTQQSVREFKITTRGRRNDTHSDYFNSSVEGKESKNDSSKNYNTNNSTINNNITPTNSLRLLSLKNQLTTLVHSHHLYKKHLHHAHFIFQLQENAKRASDEAATAVVLRSRH